MRIAWRWTIFFIIFLIGLGLLDFGLFSYDPSDCGLLPELYRNAQTEGRLYFRTQRPQPLTVNGVTFVNPSCILDKSSYRVGHGLPPIQVDEFFFPKAVVINVAWITVLSAIAATALSRRRGKAAQ